MGMGMWSDLGEDASKPSDLGGLAILRHSIHLVDSFDLDGLSG